MRHRSPLFHVFDEFTQASASDADSRAARSARQRRPAGSGRLKKKRGDDRHPSQDLSEAGSYRFDFFFPFFLAAFFFLAMTPHLLST